MASAHAGRSKPQAKANDYRSRVSGLGACEEEQLLLDLAEFGNNNAKVQFRKERNNLYNVRSYKFSDLVNSKTVEVHPSAGEDKDVVLSTSKTKQDTPAKLQHKPLMCKYFSKMAKPVVTPPV